MTTRTGEPEWWPVSDRASANSSPSVGGCRRCGFLTAKELCSWCAEEDDSRGGAEGGRHRAMTPTPTMALGGGPSYGPLRWPEPASRHTTDPPEHLGGDSTWRWAFPLRRLSLIAAAMAIPVLVAVGLATTSDPPNAETVGNPRPIPTILLMPSIAMGSPGLPAAAIAASPTTAPDASLTSAPATPPRASPSTIPSMTASAPYEPAIAATEKLLTPVGCPTQSGLKSEVGQETWITFYNARTDTITLQWIDYDGKLQAYGAIAPHQQRSWITYVTHLWLVSDADGACLYMYEAETIAGAAVIR